MKTMIPALLLAATLVLPLPAHAIDTDFLFAFGSSGSGDGQFNTPIEIAIGAGGNILLEADGYVFHCDPSGTYLYRVDLPASVYHNSHLDTDAA